jgi:hypothetical protein
MNNEEFKAKARQVLVLADQMEVLNGGKLDTYTDRFALFEVARMPELGHCYTHVARIYDSKGGDSIFQSAYGSSEEGCIDNLAEVLRVLAASQEAHHVWARSGRY